ncbi:hypothetical protein X943_001752 [Babesia divergens]|uniref:Uncharacterized protein n=1 Tax=Babesia divergens TaxID=32595 RepID=A0AAD9GKW7_BABDI|nr:hypothetical protein X943_001752 [Babesia divergens]
MADDQGTVEVTRQHSLSKKAPIVDNFVLLFYNGSHNGSQSSASGDDASAPSTAEESFRRSLKDYLDRIEDLRCQITDKYQAKQLIQVKLHAQLIESEHQARFNACNLQTQNGIQLNYKRMLLLCEKIYTLSIQLQTLYLELAELLEKRLDHTVEIHRRSRLCCSALYDFKKQSGAT